MGDDAVRVAIRVRPFIGIERSQDCHSVVQYPSPKQIQLGSSLSHIFTYDYLYNEESTQEAVYQTCVHELVQRFFSGFNCTILAYGQTGSGKTHTMGTAGVAAGVSAAVASSVTSPPSSSTTAAPSFTSSASTSPSPDHGIIPRVIYELFALMKKHELESTYILSISFIEIYNDEIIDLLQTLPRDRRPIPTIKERENHSIEVEHIVKQEVKSVSDTLEALEKGGLQRATGSTNMNATSSRSHAIFTVMLAQKQCNDDTDSMIQSKFHFVDLAGSERIKRTGAVGDRMKEGININQGLLALGNVISALGDPTRRGAHVPFRDSKITRLLQDSLGGNSLTLMIASLSPADVNKEETLNTLQYANRAKNIKNKPVINRDPLAVKFDQLKGRIKELEMELDVWRKGQIPTQEQRAGGTISAGTVASSSSASLTASSSSSHLTLPSITSTPLRQRGRSMDFNTTGGNTASGVTNINAALVGGGGGLAPTLGLDEMIIKSSSWAETTEQLVTYDQELKKAYMKLATAKQEYNQKNDEKMKACSARDAMRRKIEELAEKFPEVKKFLVEEKDQVEKERVTITNELAAANASATGTTTASPTTPSVPTNADYLSDVDDVDGTGTNAAASSSSSSNAPFFSIISSGGTSSAFNLDLRVIQEKNALITRLLKKFLSQRTKLQEEKNEREKMEKKLEKEKRRWKRKERKRKREEKKMGRKKSNSMNNVEENADGVSLNTSFRSDQHSDSDSAIGGRPSISVSVGVSRNHNHDSDNDDDDDDDDPHSSASASSSSSDEGGSGPRFVKDMDEMFSPSLSPSVSSNPLSVLSHSDLEDLEYDSSSEKTEDELSSLQTLAQLKLQEHEKYTSVMTQEQTTLDGVITTKEIFLEQLTQQKQRTQTVYEQYEKQLANLEQEKNQNEKRILELEKLMEQKAKAAAAAGGGGTTPSSASSSSAASSSTLTATELKELARSRSELDRVTKELKLTREKFKATQESQKKQHQQDEARIKQLQLEISTAKKSRIEVTKRMEESTGKYKEWQVTCENKMKLLQKNQRKGELEIRTLHEQLSQQALQLKRAREVNNVLSKKVRDQDSATQVRTAAASNAPTPTAAGGSRLPKSRTPAGSHGGGSAGGGSINPHLLRVNSASSKGSASGSSSTGNAPTSVPSSKRNLAPSASGAGRKPLRGEILPTKRSSSANPQSAAQQSELSPAMIVQLSRDFTLFITSEIHRLNNAHEVEYLRSQVAHYRQALDVSNEIFLNASSSTPVEKIKEMEMIISSNELALRASETSLKETEARVQKENAVANVGHTSGAPTPSNDKNKAGAADTSNNPLSALEERISSRFGKYWNDSSPKKIFALLLKTVIELQYQQSHVHSAHHSKNASLRSSNVVSPSGGGAEYTPMFHSDPNETGSGHQSGYGSSTAISPPPQIGTGASAATGSTGDNSTRSPTQFRRKSNLAPVVVTPVATHPSLSASPTGTGGRPARSASVVGRSNNAGDSNEDHPPLQSKPSRGGGSLFDEDDMLASPPHSAGAKSDDESRGGGVSSLTLSRQTSLTSTLKDNFMATADLDDAFPVHSVGHHQDENEDPSLKHNSNAGNTRGSAGTTVSAGSSHPNSTTAKSQNAYTTSQKHVQVFDRLTDPQNFTGVSKLTSQHAPAHSQTARTSRATGGQNVLGEKKKSIFSAGGNVGAGISAGSSMERSPSPGPASDDSSSSHSSSNASSKQPFHMRLTDPKNFTGAQKKRWEEKSSADENAAATSTRSSSGSGSGGSGSTRNSSSSSSQQQRHSLISPDSQHDSSSSATPSSSPHDDAHPPSTVGPNSLFQKIGSSPLASSTIVSPPTSSRHILHAPAPASSSTASLSAPQQSDDEDTDSTPISSRPYQNIAIPGDDE